MIAEAPHAAGFPIIDKVVSLATANTACLVILATVLLAVSMPIVVHNGHKSPGGTISGRRRVLRAATYLTATTVAFFFLVVATGTVDIYYKVRQIVTDEETSFHSGAGVAKFCRRLQGLGQEKRFQVVLLLTGLYMLLQTFCVPGTVVLNAAVGAVMGTLVGVPYCTLLGTLGASSCYFLSKLLGVSLVEAADARLMRGRGLPYIRSQVHRYYDDLFVYMLFLRLTPILPNWLVNLASPVVGVPLKVFSGATFLGIVPQTYLTVRFGAMARVTVGKDGEEKKNTRIVTPWDTLLLAVIGGAILAGFRLKKKFVAAGPASAEMETAELVDTDELRGRAAKKHSSSSGSV